MTKFITKGQVSLEFAVILVAIVGALVGMSLFMRSSIARSYKNSIEVFSQGALYDPDTTTGEVGR